MPFGYIMIHLHHLPQSSKACICRRCLLTFLKASDSMEGRGCQQSSAHQAISVATCHAILLTVSCCFCWHVLTYLPRSLQISSREMSKTLLPRLTLNFLDVDWDQCVYHLSFSWFLRFNRFAFKLSLLPGLQHPKWMTVWQCKVGMYSSFLPSPWCQSENI